MRWIGVITVLGLLRRVERRTSARKCAQAWSCSVGSIPIYGERRSPSMGVLSRPLCLVKKRESSESRSPVHVTQRIENTQCSRDIVKC